MIWDADIQMKHITIFTDGSCLGNPGPGGWATILRFGEHQKEMSGGFKLTTNNRMEMLAVIEGLENLTETCQVDLYTDSQYVRNAVEKGWLKNWHKNGWKTANKKPVKNKDLWTRMQPQLDKHTVSFHWVKGHSGHPENERCDHLARHAASQPRLPVDEGHQ